MSFFFDQERIFALGRRNPMTVVALALIALLIVGYLLFIFRTLVPRWQQRTELLATLDAAEAALVNRSQQQQHAAAGLGQELEAAQADFNELANRFLTEAQAAAFLAEMYDSAAETAVSIVELQAQAVPQGAGTSGEKLAYDRRVFRLEANGELVQLNEFVGRIEQTAVLSVHLQNLSIASGPDGAAATLTVDLLLYTSPFSTGESVAELPEPVTPPVDTPPASATPTPAPSPTPDVTSLLAQLDDAWAAEDWPEVIRLIQEIRQLAPNEAGMMEKLYAARVNYGYQLIILGEPGLAAEQFDQALTILPGGIEAEEGLQSLFAPPPTATPEAIIHVVQRGDTLYAIARRYGCTVEALKAANGLANNKITPGQQLVIP